MPVDKVHFDLSEDSNASTTSAAARWAAKYQWVPQNKLRFYTTVAVALAAGLVLVVGIMLVFNSGYGAFRKKLTTRPMSANVHGLIMPGASHIAKVGNINGSLGSATSGSALSNELAQADKEKVFAFRPRFDGQNGSGNSLIKPGNEKVSNLQSRDDARLRSRGSVGKAEVSGSSYNSRAVAPANVAGGLPGPFESEQSSFLRRKHSQIASDYSAASATANEAAAIVALGADTSQGFPMMA
jgi:hypothetical protein